MILFLKGDPTVFYDASSFCRNMNLNAKILFIFKTMYHNIRESILRHTMQVFRNTLVI